MQKALIEGVKELLRVVVIAVIPVLIMSLDSGEINLKVIGITAAIAALKFIDKVLHEVGKELDNANLTKGLTRF